MRRRYHRAVLRGWVAGDADLQRLDRGKHLLAQGLGRFAPDARHLLHGFEKIANRVTTGIILAALIVGAALMMRINSAFQIFGYPGIAMICFLIATGGSAWLVIGILWKDYKDDSKPKE